uniref:DUF7746 domain-containing protein n=1 Tax=Oryza rufipogon TaxID=4529 RepID=A0A0E0N3S6_ORYRU
MPQIQNMTYYNGKEIVEWNLDGFTEYQIFTLCHQMIMYANACIANGNKEREAANMIVIGFSGQLKGWWNNYLNETQRQEILCAVKRDDQGRPLPDRDGNGNPIGFHMEEKDEPIQEDDQVVGTIQKYMKQKWYTEVLSLINISVKPPTEFVGQMEDF